jgi:hypothetical protein
MTDNHFVDVDKKDGMSLTLALIVLDRLNTTERIDVAHDNLIEAVKVVSAAAKYRVPRKLEAAPLFGYGNRRIKCPICGELLVKTRFCGNCGQAVDWS